MRPSDQLEKVQEDDQENHHENKLSIPNKTNPWDDEKINSTY